MNNALLSTKDVDPLLLTKASLAGADVDKSTASSFRESKSAIYRALREGSDERRLNALYLIGQDSLKTEAASDPKIVEHLLKIVDRAVASKDKSGRSDNMPQLLMAAGGLLALSRADDTKLVRTLV